MLDAAESIPSPDAPTDALAAQRVDVNVRAQEQDCVRSNVVRQCGDSDPAHNAGCQARSFISSGVLCVLTLIEGFKIPLGSRRDSSARAAARCPRMREAHLARHLDVARQSVQHTAWPVNVTGGGASCMLHVSTNSPTATIATGTTPRHAVCTLRAFWRWLGEDMPTISAMSLGNERSRRAKKSISATTGMPFCAHLVVYSATDASVLRSARQRRVTLLDQVSSKAAEDILLFEYCNKLCICGWSRVWVNPAGFRVGSARVRVRVPILVDPKPFGYTAGLRTSNLLWYLTHYKAIGHGYWL
ncbi:hypothetical protein GGX14DRAFT_392795 [Mycena pura]|uniref:Uncharacterized protein n=1 Tax=Mycena pura TaxID=153505 RepID=A0AAD6VKC6_9AGAR|nr:hypothetical protein GGX14DRAFT_392795 [Mycena pura]